MASPVSDTIELNYCLVFLISDSLNIISRPSLHAHDCNVETLAGPKASHLADGPIFNVGYGRGSGFELLIGVSSSQRNLLLAGATGMAGIAVLVQNIPSTNWPRDGRGT